MSYIKGTPIERLVDRAIDGWSNLVGFVKPSTKKLNDTKKVANKTRKMAKGK